MPRCGVLGSLIGVKDATRERTPTDQQAQSWRPLARYGAIESRLRRSNLEPDSVGVEEHFMLVRPA